MAALPYMQLYIADYLADTMHLSTEEHGAYLLLMFNYWQTGKPIPKTRLAKIARLSNDRWISVESSLNEFFSDNGMEWVHERIERDLTAVMATQKQRSAAGKASAEKRKNTVVSKGKNNDRSTVVEMSLNENPTNIDTDIDKDIKDKHQEILPGAEKKQLQPVDVPAQEIFINLPLIDGTEFGVTADYVSELQGLYPAIDVPQQLRTQRGWLDSNPKNRKTKTGIKRFINAWMAREQNSAPKIPMTGGRNASAPTESAAKQKMRAALTATHGAEYANALMDGHGGNLRRPVDRQERAGTDIELGSGDWESYSVSD